MTTIIIIIIIMIVVAIFRKFKYSHTIWETSAEDQWNVSEWYHFKYHHESYVAFASWSPSAKGIGRGWNRQSQSSFGVAQSRPGTLSPYRCNQHHQNHQTYSALCISRFPPHRSFTISSSSLFPAFVPYPSQLSFEYQLWHREAGRAQLQDLACQVHLGVTWQMSQSWWVILSDDLHEPWWVVDSWRNIHGRFMHNNNIRIYVYIYMYIYMHII